MSGPEFGTPDFDRVVEALRLMGHPLRLLILRNLARGETAVGEIAEQTGQSLSLISQQLALLRKAGLVQTRREAKQVFYAMAVEQVSAITQALEGLMGLVGEGVILPPILPAPKRQDAMQISAALFARVEPRG